MSKWRDSQYFKLDLVTALFCLIPMIIGGIFYNQLPEQVPIHFDVNNVADNYANKNFALFGIPLLMMILHLVCVLITENDPRRSAQPEIMQYLVRFIVPVLAIVVESVTIMYVLNDGADVGKIISLAMGILFLLIGNYFPKLRLNGTLGIKVPWTLSSEENWNKTHRLAGILIVISSILMIVLALVGYSIIGLIALLLSIVIAIIYSFVLAKKSAAK